MEKKCLFEKRSYGIYLFNFIKQCFVIERERDKVGFR